MEKAVNARREELEAALLSIDREGARKIILGEQGAGSGLEALEALVVPALERIGTGWEEGRYSLSQVYMSGRICEELMEALRADTAVPGAACPGLAISVLDDYHLLGMKLVASALRAAGLQPLVYGRQEVGELVERAKADGVRVLLVSVLMLRSALRVRELREALDRAGLGKLRLAVGGAPFRFDAGLWREVGADGTADSAAGAVALSRRLLEEAAI